MTAMACSVWGWKGVERGGWLLLNLQLRAEVGPGGSQGIGSPGQTRWHWGGHAIS